MNLNSISLAMYRAGNAQFTMERLFFATDTGSWYKFTVPSSLTNADAYQSTAAIYPVIDDGRGVVNLLPYSEEFENAAWTKTYTTIATGSNLLLETADTNNHTAVEAFQQKNADTFTGWFVLKKQSRRYVDIGFSNVAQWTAAVQVKYDLDTNLIVNNAAGVTDTALVELDDGKVLIYITGVSINTTSSSLSIGFNDDSSNRFPSYAGDITKGGYVYQASVNRGAFTSYADYQYTGPYLNGPAQPVGLLLAANRDGRGVVNQIYNQMAGGVAGSSGTMPTTWFTTTALTGLTRTLAFGEENGIKYTDITVSGTPSAAGNYDVGFAGNTQIAALTGQVWAESLYLKLQAGSLTGVSSMIVRFNEYTSGGAFVTGQDSSAFSTPTGADLDTQRQSKTATLNGGGTTAAVQPLFRIALTGAAVDFTLRIGEPQVERDTATAVQKNDIYLGGPGDHMGNATSANRMTYALLPYGGVRNRLSNNMMVGASAPSTAPTSWTLTGSSIGLSWSVVAVGTVDIDGVGTVPCLDLRLSGTASGSGFESVFQSATTQFAAATGEDVTESIYCAIIDGDLTNITSIGLSVYEYSSVPGFLRNSATTAVSGSTLTRYSKSVTLGASTAYARSGLLATITGAGAVDVTIRLALPQIEKASSATAVQKVTSVYDISQPGLPQIPYEYGDGSSDFHTLGKQYFGLKQDGNGVVNGLLHTSRFQNPVWTASAATVTDCSVTGPSGNTDATTIADNVTNTSHGVSQVTTAFPSDEEITIQVKAKAGTLDWMRVEADDGSSNIIRCFFDINTGAVGTESVGGTGVVSDSGVIADSNGYSIYYLTGTPSTTNTGSLTIRIRTATADTVTSYAGSGGTILVADAQVNLGTIEDYQANSYTLGGSLGTAGLFCDPTQQWSVGGDFLTFKEETSYITLLGKASASTGNRTLHVGVLNGNFQLLARGATTDSGVDVNEGSLHAWLLTWDGSTLLLYLDNNDPITCSVGSASEEAEDILWGARTGASPSNRFLGYWTPLLMLARALTASEARQFMDYHCNRIGVSA